jgi:hypothetical protein
MMCVELNFALIFDLSKVAEARGWYTKEFEEDDGTPSVSTLDDNEVWTIYATRRRMCQDRAEPWSLDYVGPFAHSDMA